MDFSSYDDWKLDNDEPSSFVCPACELTKDIDELAYTDESCIECLAKEMEREQC